VKHSRYSLRHSIIRVPLESHLLVIDSLLDSGVVEPEERRHLLMDHELLAASIEFFLTFPLMTEDKNGFPYLPLMVNEHTTWTSS
jgi:hypothetical protein